MGELGLCTIGDIAKNVATQLLLDITTDPGLLTVIVRMLHNKAVYWFFFSARCYLLYFDASQLAFFLSPFLLPFVFAAVLPSRRRLIILAAVALMPFFFIVNPLSFDLSQRILAYKGFYMFLAVLGCGILIARILKSGWVRGTKRRQS